MIQVSHVRQKNVMYNTSTGYSSTLLLYTEYRCCLCFRGGCLYYYCCTMYCCTAVCCLPYILLVIRNAIGYRTEPAFFPPIICAVSLFFFLSARSLSRIFFFKKKPGAAQWKGILLYYRPYILYRYCCTIIVEALICVWRGVRLGCLEVA